MSLSSKEHWKERSLQDAINRINLTEDFINKLLVRYYQKASDDLLKEIENFYKKYADSEGISIEEAKKRIKSATFNDIDFAELSRQAIQSGDEELNDRLRVLSQKGQLSRLELLDLNVNVILSKLYTQETESVYRYLVDTYFDGYYNSIYNVQGFCNIGTSFTHISEAVIVKAVTESWHGSNFSERIWGHRTNLAEDLRGTITDSLIKGQDFDKTSRLMKKDLGVSFSDAKRLVRTESNYVHNQATLDAYAEYADIERYRFLATLDFKTSEPCRKLDGKDFETTEATVGENYPPMHPNCRSTTVPKFDDLPVGQRIARHLNEKSYYVPGSTTYGDWFSGLPEAERNGMLAERSKAKNKSQDKIQYDNYREAFKSGGGRSFPKTFGGFQELKYNNPESWKAYKKEYRRINREAKKDAGS